MKRYILITLIILLFCGLTAKDINYSFNYLIISADKVKKYDYDFSGKDLNNFSQKLQNSFKVKPTNSLIISQFSGEDIENTNARINRFYQGIDKESYTLFLLMGPWQISGEDCNFVCSSPDKISYEYLMNLYEFMPSRNALMLVFYPKKNKPDFSEYNQNTQVNQSGKHIIFVEADDDDLQDVIQSCQKIFDKIAKTGKNNSANEISQYFLSYAVNEKLNLKSYQLTKENDYILINSGENNE